MRGKIKVYKDGREYEIEHGERERWIVSRTVRKRYKEGECPVWDLVGVFFSYEDAMKAIEKGRI